MHKSLSQSISKLLPPSENRSAIGLSFEGAIANVPGAIIVLDGDRTVRYVNKAFLELSGFSGNPEVHGISFSKLFSNSKAYDEFSATLDTNDYIKDFDFAFAKKDGRKVWVSIAIRSRKLEDPQVIHVAVLTDISRRKAKEIENADLVTQLKELVITDELTGVYNLRGLRQEGARELKHARRLGYDVTVIMFDLDHFKKVNDTYGHAAGDVALKHAVSVCRSQLRNIDSFGRYGGEEFVIIAPVTDIKSATIVAEKIRKKIEKTSFEVENVSDGTKRQVTLTVSMGVADLSVLDATNVDIMEMVKYADIALYHAKNTGRNKSVLCTVNPSTKEVILLPVV